MPALTDEQHDQAHQFCFVVDKIVEEQYGLLDGGDQCYYLITTGVVTDDMDADAAARITAQVMGQA